MEYTQSSVTETIISTINTIFSNLFSSIDNNFYSILDNLIFINNDILNNSLLKKLLESNTSNNLIIIANSLLLGLAIFYCFKLLFSHYMYVEIEKPYQFVFKLLIYSICVNFSYSICEQILNINNLLSSSILEIGSKILNIKINFENLIINLNTIISVEQNNFNLFSVDGILKSFCSIGIFSLIFSYSLRYILIKVFVLISPFAIISLINNSTSWFFKSWIRSFLGLLIMQTFVALVLLIIFSLDFNLHNLITKFIYIGGIIALSKVGLYVKELIGGLSTDVVNYFSNFRSFMK